MSNPMRGIALLVRKFGKRCDGGYEVFLAAADVLAMSPHGQVQETPAPDGTWLRYYPNRTIDGGRLEHAAPGGATGALAPDGVTPESVTEAPGG